MKSSLETQNKIAGAIICVAIGVSLGIIIDNILAFSYGSEVSFEFDIASVLTLIVTIAIAVILDKNLNTKERVRGAERNALIKNLDTIDADFTKKIRELTRGGYEFVYVTQVIKRHRMRANKLVELAIKHNLLSRSSEGSIELLKKMKNILELMTDTPQAGEDIEDGVRLQDGKLFFSEKRTSKIVSELFDFNSAVFEIVVEVHAG